MGPYIAKSTLYRYEKEVIMKNMYAKPPNMGQPQTKWGCNYE